jgi:hypothetical protein
MPEARSGTHAAPNRRESRSVAISHGAQGLFRGQAPGERLYQPGPTQVHYLSAAEVVDHGQRGHRSLRMTFVTGPLNKRDPSFVLFFCLSLPQVPTYIFADCRHYHELTRREACIQSSSAFRRPAILSPASTPDTTAVSNCGTPARGRITALSLNLLQVPVEILLGLTLQCTIKD